MDPAGRPIRVVIVEREPLIQRRLADILATDPHTEVVGLAASSADGDRLAGEQRPDVILIGTRLTDAPGLAAATQLRRHQIALIVLTPRERDDELFAAILAGAFAYHRHNIPADALVELVRRVATGEFVINELLLDQPHRATRLLELFRAMDESAEK